MSSGCLSLACIYTSYHLGKAVGAYEAVKELREIKVPEEQDEIFQQFCFKYQLGKYDLE
jgi:hypothetical protein